MKMIFQEIFPPKNPVTNQSKMYTGVTGPDAPPPGHLVLGPDAPFITQVCQAVLKRTFKLLKRSTD